jgi:hypothetical protein
MRLHKLNIHFIALLDWFVNKYDKTTSEDCKENRKRIAADWHPADSFKIFVLQLFSGGSYAGCTRYPMNNRDIIGIGLYIIKQCGMYAKEYKVWIACKAAKPRIVETLETFKDFWSSKISLVNQTAIPTGLHGYGMAIVNGDDTLVVSYGKSIATFGAAFAATHELGRTQGTTIASLQGQVNAM